MNYMLTNYIYKTQYKLQKDVFFIEQYFNKVTILPKLKIYQYFFAYPYLIELNRLSFIYYSLQFLFVNIFKAHGINMRVIKKQKKLRLNLVFLRLGYSHGLLLKLPHSCIFRVFKRRYFLVSTYDFTLLSNLTYHLRNFRMFFRYKLIGIKLLRDSFKVVVGKKKAF